MNKYIKELINESKTTQIDEAYKGSDYRDKFNDLYSSAIEIEFLSRKLNDKDITKEVKTILKAIDSINNSLNKKYEW